MFPSLPGHLSLQGEQLSCPGLVAANCTSGFSKGHRLVTNSFQVSSCCGGNEDAECE